VNDKYVRFYDVVYLIKSIKSFCIDTVKNYALVVCQVMEKYPLTPMTPKEIWQLIEKENLKEIRYFFRCFDRER